MNLTERKDLNKPIILIVDDVPKNIQVLGTILSKLECELAVAMNGQQALDTIEKIKPDLILLDVMMPILDGHEVCRRLKSSDETKDIPIIFLTAKTETEDIVTGFELGAVDYVTKPFIGNELLARVKTHLSLKITKENLKEEIATKNKFFSIISHDLRGSFGIILSLVQLIKENRDDLSPEETDELLSDIVNASKNTIDLLQNLLEWSRSQTGRIKFNPEKLSISELFSEIIAGQSEIAENKNIKLLSYVNSNKTVFADKNMILLVIRNLISNAIKFTPNGGEIDLTADDMDEFIKISVTDNGVGIKSDRVDSLFHIETKTSTSGTENEQGNGLGLILCKEFVERNKGDIKVESEAGRGTTVWLTLPQME